MGLCYSGRRLCKSNLNINERKDAFVILEQSGDGNGQPKRVIMSIKGWNAVMKLMGVRVRIKRLRSHSARFLIEVTGATEKPEIEGSDD